jgi:DNA-binding protein H-NS
MSDFLRNLRSSHKKDAPLPRKNPDGNFYQKTERRTISDRRNVNDLDTIDTLAQHLGDALPEILENMTTLAEQVERIAATNELTAESKVRQHNAVANFFNNLNKMLTTNTDNTENDTSQDHPQEITTSYASGTHYTKDDILSIIRNMRNQGATFSIIADYLKEKGMPTFSGKGEWHAQTIHRLCK